VILHTLRTAATQEEAARLLGVSTKTLYNKLRLYGRTADTRPTRPIRTGELGMGN
jgi:DNA-binding NtrC family response regulator